MNKRNALVPEGGIRQFGQNRLHNVFGKVMGSPQEE